MEYALAQSTGRKLSEGKHYPLGATPSPGGVNFAIYSQNAREVFLLLFDTAEGAPADIIKLENNTRHVWHVFVHGIGAGQLYGYKIRGEHDPARGLRFNEHKLLIDPYAKALSSRFVNPDNLLLGYDPGSPDRDLSRDTRDNTHVVPRGVVIDDDFDWQGVAAPGLPLEKLVIYETHVKGFTAHKSSGAKNPGTYLGFVEKIPHLKDIGVNAVELLPVHEYYVEDFLVQRGLTNYWGYNTIGFFAPESSYGTGTRPGCQVEEFKHMVRELHRAGIEVILDVVYNHTAEGNELGPTVSFKGIDNSAYYCLAGAHGQPYRYYMNYTGCGNSMNLGSPPVIRFVMDSLRYWAEVMRVDGFRFDLASVLGREDGLFQKSASFFDAISQDPVLCRVKLIAEPWDIGTYQVGNFPIDWSEWNGRFRDVMRKFAKGDGGQLREVGARVTGSCDLYGDDGRSAYNSVNFITCHDGFTLRDLVSYNVKHNEANGEGNGDGTNDNHSWNCGAEGDTDDPAVTGLRGRLARNHICHLLFSLGTPMVLGGDEFFRTQRGNNNAYCQDNEISWFDWELADKHRDLVDFFRKAVAFRKRHTMLQRRKFFMGIDTDADAVKDITWYGPNLDLPAWDNPEERTLCYQIDGSEEQSDAGDYLLFFILNADFAGRYVKLPPHEKYRWHRVVDTSLEPGQDFLDTGKEVALEPGDHYIVNPRSTVVLLGKPA